MKHGNNFDFIRLVAAGLVLISHQFALQGYDEPIVLGGTLGGLGVGIFFSISGYLVSQSWNRSPHLITFARKRLTRIWPGLAGVTVFCALILGPLVTTLPLSDYFASSMWRGYFWQLAFQIKPMLPGVFERGPHLAINGSLWSIPLELKWYVIVACLGVFGLVRRPAVLAASALIVVACVVVRAVRGDAPDQLANFGGFFIIGMTLSTLRGWLLDHRLVVLGLVALGVVLTVGAGYGLIYVVVPAVSIVIGEGSSPIARSAGRFGDFSYGVYLYAWPVQKTVLWLADGDIAVPLALLISAVVTSGFAVLSWKLIEQPAMAALKRSEQRARGRARPASAASASRADRSRHDDHQEA